MKNNTLKKVAILLLILVIILISFVGIYKKQLNKMVNVIPDYKYGMDLSSIREVRLNVSNETVTKYYDENGDEIAKPDGESEDENTNTTSKEVPVNPSEKLTAENFEKAKEIFTKRLDAINTSEYQLRQDENGYVVVEFPENDNTDYFVESLIYTGKFEMTDKETGKVLLDNTNIKDAAAVTYSSDGKTASAYLIIDFDEEGKQKLEDISKTYVATKDEEGNETKKIVTITIDDQTIASTYFGQTMSNGQLQLQLGESTSSDETLLTYYREAAIIANSIKFGKLPISYVAETETELSSTIRQDTIQLMWIIVAIVIIVLCAYLIVKYNKGLMVGLSWIGFIGLYLLVLRYTNSIITINSIIGILVICIYQYILLNAILHNKFNRSFKEILTKYAINAIPMFVIAIIFTFASKSVVSSFGIVLFWGSAIMAIYNLIITKNLIDEK